MSIVDVRRRCGTAVRAVTGRHAGEDRPLTGYLVLGGGYAVTAATALVASARKGTAGGTVSPGDVVRLTIATHRLSRLITKESITAPLRAPFTRHVGPGMASEVEEEVVTDPQRHPVPHAVGELLTCPFCMAQWIATAMVGAHLLAPRQARLVATVLTVAAGADVLHFLYSALDRLEQEGEEDNPGEPQT